MLTPVATSAQCPRDTFFNRHDHRGNIDFTYYFNIFIYLIVFKILM